MDLLSRTRADEFRNAGLQDPTPYLFLRGTLQEVLKKVVVCQFRITGSARPLLSCHIDLRYLIAMEHTFTCPSCGEEISMVLDLSVSRHTYIEDCEVCCTPVEISYTVQDDALASFDAKTLE